MAFRSAIFATAGLLCVLACLASVTAMSEEQLALMKQLHDMCVGETGVDESTIDAFRTGTFADDPKLKCYMKCTFEQIAIIDDDSNAIDGDAMIAMLPEEFAEVGPPIIRKCQTVQGADACETAFLFNKCFYTENPKSFMLI